MHKCCLLLLLTIPLQGHCQSFAGVPFYKPAQHIPSTAHIEGYSNGSFNANGIVIDLFESLPLKSPDFERIAGWSVEATVDGRKPSQIFHFYIQYQQLNVVFGYDLLVEPIKGTNQIRCTFKVLTDPETAWQRDKSIPPVPFPAARTPLVIESGAAIAIKTLPLGQGRIAPIHYLRLSRTDLRRAAVSAQ